MTQVELQKSPSRSSLEERRSSELANLIGHRQQEIIICSANVFDCGLCVQFVALLIVYICPLSVCYNRAFLD